MPRKEGMERKDLLAANVKIFKVQGEAMDKYAKERGHGEKGLACCQCQDLQSSRGSNGQLCQGKRAWRERTCLLPMSRSSKFKGKQWTNMPRKEGMERKDLLAANVKIFKVQGEAMD